jgi:hypothetical protein
LVLGPVNDPEVIDTVIRLRGLARLAEVRNGDGRQKPNNGHDGHDFNQCKAAVALFLVILIWFAFSLSQWNNAVGEFIYYDNLFT